MANVLSTDKKTAIIGALSEGSSIRAIERMTGKGETVWDGIVELVDLHGHPHANTAYAWLHDTGDPEKPAQHVTVLTFRMWCLQ